MNLVLILHLKSLKHLRLSLTIIFQFFYLYNNTSCKPFKFQTMNAAGINSQSLKYRMLSGCKDTVIRTNEIDALCTTEIWKNSAVWLKVLKFYILINFTCKIVKFSSTLFIMYFSGKCFSFKMKLIMYSHIGDLCSLYRNLPPSNLKQMLFNNCFKNK